MTVARYLNIDRESAAKYSFLLATPITFAAVIFDLTKFTFGIPIIVGVLASFIVGIAVIKFLMNNDLDNTFKTLNNYLMSINKSNYEFQRRKIMEYV